MSQTNAIQLRFVGSDPARPDAAAVARVAREVVTRLQAADEPVAPLYTGEKGAAEVFQWLLAAATVAAPLLTLTDLVLKHAQLQNELKKLRQSASSSPPPTITINLIFNGKVVTTSTAEQLSDEELLARYMAQLPATLDANAVAFEVHVPPTPPRSL